MVGKLLVAPNLSSLNRDLNTQNSQKTQTDPVGFGPTADPYDIPLVNTQKTMGNRRV